MKRRVMPSLILAFAVAASLLADPGSPRVITLWSLFTGGDGEFFDAMVSTFNSSQKAILLKTTTINFDDYYSKLAAAIAARTAPDLVIIHASNLANFAPQGLLVPLDSYLVRAGVDLGDFESAPLSACRFGGKLYALPLDVHPLIMYYNRDLLKRAGVRALPNSYDDLVAAAKAVQTKTGAIGIAADDASGTYRAYTLTRIFMSFLAQQGGAVLDPTSTHATFDSPAGLSSLKALESLANKEGAIPKGLDYDASVAAFRQGKAGFHFNGVWATGIFEQQPGLNFGATQFPAVFGKHAAWTDSHTFAIPVQKRLDERKVFDDLAVMDWMTSHGELWAKAGHIPTRKIVLTKTAFIDLAYRNEYAVAVKSVFAPPPTPRWNLVFDAMSDELEAAVAADAEPRAALAKMAGKVNAILAKR